MDKKRVKLPPAYVEGAESVEPFGSKTFHKGEWKARPWQPASGGKAQTAATNWNGSWDDAVRATEE